MSAYDTGLHYRIKRLAQQIADQHRNLAALRREIDAAFARGALGDACSDLKRFELALAAHFDLEQGFLFPALHGLETHRVADLEILEREHAGLLAELSALVARVESETGEFSQRALARWLATLRDHEMREERLVGQIADRA